MRIGICSDSHGDFAAWQRYLELVGPCDYYWHAGDILGYGESSEALAAALAALPNFIAVGGNCDRLGDEYRLEHQLPGERILRLDGHNVYLCHSHILGDYGSRERARSLACALLINGHSHVKRLYEDQGLLLLNPGSISRPRDGEASCALYENGVFRLLSLVDGRVLATATWPKKDASIHE